MNKRLKLTFLLIATTLSLTALNTEGKNYNNFKVAVYARAYEVKQMNNLKWLESVWNGISWSGES